MSTEPPANRDHLLTTGLLLAIFMLGTALRLYDLAGPSLSGDEFFTGVLAQLDLRSMVARAAADVHPPLSYLVARFFVVILGDSDFVLRLPPALLGSLSILLVYKVGEMLWTREVGIIGAFLLAVAPYHIQYSRFARYPSLTVFLTLCSLMLLLKALEAGKKAAWIGFALCASLSLYNSYFAFMPLASEVIFAAGVIAENWIFGRRRGGDSLAIRTSSWVSFPARQALMFALSLLLVGLLVLPWFPTMLRQLFGEGIGWQGLGGGMMPGVRFSLGYFHLWLERYSGVDGAPVLLLLGLFVLGLVGCKGKHILLVTSWIAMPFLFALLVSATHHFSPRYAIFVLSIYLLVIGKGLWSLAALLQRPLPRLRAHRAWPLLFALSLAVLLGLANVAPLRRYYLQRKADWRAAAEYLRDNMLPGGIILVDGKAYRDLADAFVVEYFLSYYLDSCGMEETPVLAVERGLWADLQSLELGNREVWTVLWYPNRPGPWKRMDQIAVIDFEDVSIIWLREPSEEVLQDTVSMLRALPDLLPTGKAHFDVHLALAEIYLRTERFEEARSELEMASQVNPDSALAFQDLAEVFAELEEFSQPEDVQIQHPLSRSLGQVIALLGYNMSPARVRAGGRLNITLWWEVLAKMDRDYSVFIHVVGSDDRIWGSEDRLLRQLRDGGYPTSNWRVGEVVREQYGLELPLDMPAGEYRVKAGLYYWETGERLPIRDEDGQRAAENAILLQPINVDE